MTVVEVGNLHTLRWHVAGHAELATTRWEIVETLVNRLSTPEVDAHD
ncbi:hypothetical protein [Nocardia sp. NPDC005998]